MASRLCRGRGRRWWRVRPRPGPAWKTRLSCFIAAAVLGLSWSIVAAPSVQSGAAVAATGPGSVPTPTVEGPILPSRGISFLGSTLFPPSTVGYEQSEFFLSGTATAYTSAPHCPRTANGMSRRRPRRHTRPGSWSTGPSTPQRFDGTVVVEWLNVTAGIDAPAAWLNAHVQMIRAGMAYVGVDAQAGGINGEPGSIASEDGAGGIKQTDPARYGSLQPPWRQLLVQHLPTGRQGPPRRRSRTAGGLTPKRVLALGESQSAFRLVTYIDALQPRSPGIYDGYFVYSRGGDGADLSQAPQATIATPTPTYIRTDLHVPVFIFETETDLLGLGYLAARQPPTRYIREWETAGTAHDDTYGLLYARAIRGTAPPTPTPSTRCSTRRTTRSPASSTAPPPSTPGPTPTNSGRHCRSVNHWLASGTPPPESPRLDVDPRTTTPSYGRQRQRTRRDPTRPGRRAGGQALGAGPARYELRSDACRSGPSTVSGQALCGIFGTTVPFGAAKIAALYPTHATFVTKWDEATAAEVKQGYLLPSDATALDGVAAQSSVGG